MSQEDRAKTEDPSRPRRREVLAYSAALGGTLLAPRALAAQAPPRRYDMKKSINLWAFPYPAKWTLKECFELAKDAGFDGVEINFDLEGEFSAESSDAQIREIGRLAASTGIAISGVCSFLFWQFSMTSNNPEERKRGTELAGRMIEAAALLGTEDLLVVPGAVYMIFRDDYEPVPFDVCNSRAREAVRALLPKAEQHRVNINIENIFANGFLFSPTEMNEFVDGFKSERIKIHFDTGNIMQYQFPEHWIPILGKRIKHVHFKEWDKRTREFTLNTFRTLLDGTTNWPAVMEALDKIGYRGYLTFEYFHPFEHYPEVLIRHTADTLDYMLGRKR